LIAPYRATMVDEMNEVVEQTPYLLERKKQNGSLGGWFSDVILNGTKSILGVEADFAVQNHGGIRIPSIPKGDITIGKVFEVMPFDNKLVLLELDGGQVRQLVSHFMSLGGWPTSEGIVIQKADPLQIEVKGKPIEDNEKYKVIISDYIANGGDRCDFLKAIPRKDLGVLIRTLAIDYLRKKSKTVQPASYYQNRIIDAK
jgi:5'-nucleotidase/2',3'-cyclic phosphodiesterase and related esterases